MITLLLVGVVELLVLISALMQNALTKEVREVENSREWSPGACYQGKTHIRGADEELLSLERT
jgi:hypothetical protein